MSAGKHETLLHRRIFYYKTHLRLKIDNERSACFLVFDSKGSSIALPATFVIPIKHKQATPLLSGKAEVLRKN